MGASRHRVLLVGDCPDDWKICRRLIRQDAHASYQFLEVATAREGLRLCAQQRPDCVLLDHGLPDLSALEFLEELARESERPVPVIVMTDDDSGPDLEARSLQCGAQEHLHKSDIDSALLIRSIRYAMERNRLLDELKRTHRQQLETKDSFLSHVSHELRSPLNPIYQFVSLVRDEVGGTISEDHRRYLGIALRNIDHLCRLIDELVESTRVGSGKLSIVRRLVDPRELVELTTASADPTAEERNIVLQVTGAQDLPLVHVDPERIEQVVRNLLSNALKFTPDGGEVHVHVGRWSEHPDFVHVSVRDTGRGIHSADAEHVFDRWFQAEHSDGAKRKGLGLGLYLSKQLIVRHGGAIWVESKLGQGSTFQFTLPAFSMAELLRPVLQRENEPHLLSVETNHPSEFVLHEMEAVVQRCTLPDRDVVLPLVDAKILAVLGADTGGTAQTTVRRIRAQLGKSPVLRGVGAKFEIEVAPVGRNGRSPLERIEELVLGVASGKGENVYA